MINTYCWKSHKICQCPPYGARHGFNKLPPHYQFRPCQCFLFLLLGWENSSFWFFFLEKKTLPSWIKAVDILLPLLIHLSHDITADCLIVLNSSHHVSQSLVVLQEIIRESVVRVVVSVFLKIERMRWFYQESNWFIIIVYNLIKLNSAICNC